MSTKERPAPPSYECGTSDVPLRHMTIGEALAATAAAFPDRDALIVRHQGIRWTWSELRERAISLAAGLIGLGLEPGDRVGIWSPNCAEWVLTQLATAEAGLILVTINPAYRTAELEHALRLSECRALVIADRFKTSDYLAMLLEIVPEAAGGRPGRIGSRRLPRLDFIVQIGAARCSAALPFDTLGANQGEARLNRLSAIRGTLTPDDPINIQFTSGTTGAPKGATLTHHNILNNGFFVGERMRIGAEDRICLPVPLYHCFGMVMGVLNCVCRGTAMVFPGEAFEPRAVLESVEAERCTALYGVPTMFIAELADPEFGRFDLSSLRTGIMAGAPCPVDVMKRVMIEMHMPEITICYGMTETSPVSFQTRADADLETRVATVGTVHPFVEVKIVDEAGQVVFRGETGELLTRGYSVMAGYWGEQERTAEAIDAAGWMHTGDLAVLDGEGRCRIVGRLKDMIIRGGENIYPAEIENFLFGHPDILDAAVFGIPDEKYGEEVCAFLKVRAVMTASDVEAFCRGRIAHFKVPRIIRFVDDFPMTVTGKIQKFAMRDRLAAELGRSPGTPRPEGSNARG